MVATSISLPKAATVTSSASALPLVATITGSKTMGSSGFSAFSCSRRSATCMAVKALPIIPIFTESTPISPTTASIWASTISAGTGWVAVTPSVFWAVIAVIAVIGWPPSIATVLISA